MRNAATGVLLCLYEAVFGLYKLNEVSHHLSENKRKGGAKKMKRVRSACIMQTLVFTQREELCFTAEKALGLNRTEFEKYKADLEKTNTRYQLLSESEEADGSVVVKIRKQYNEKTDVSEYFE